MGKRYTDPIKVPSVPGTYFLPGILRAHISTVVIHTHNHEHFNCSVLDLISRTICHIKSLHIMPLYHHRKLSPCWTTLWSLVLILMASTDWTCHHLLVEASSSPSGMVLRIRLADGSMEKVIVPQGAEDTMTVSDLLKPFSIDENANIQVGASKIDNTSNSLSSLQVKHGTLITIQSSIQKPTESRFSQLKVDPHTHTWDPFPDLAKDFEHALLKSKTKRAANKSMSYGAIAQLQSSLHVVEAQPEGPLKRVYMCKFSAERFHVNGLLKKKSKTDTTGGVMPRVGLLLGTIQKERVDKTPRKARTSLSSQTSDAEFCTVAKVQALWEPPGQTKTDQIVVYDAAVAHSLLENNPRVLALAERLDLVPVGWIFSHSDIRHEQDDALPVYGLDVHVGATLQIANMKAKGRLDGKPFVTLAMDANTGATEAFQLSDVGVQMVHEGILLVDPNHNQREVKTKHNIIINDKETKILDSVLCLVNTAMLSHEGIYTGGSPSSSIKKNGNLTNKTKKTLLGMMDDDRQLLQQLCDFNTLLALDELLAEEDSLNLCQSVKKWARGQKQGTQVDAKVKLQLRSVLET